MKIKVLLVFVLVISLLAFTACSQDNGELPDDPENIEEPESEEEQDNEEDEDINTEEPAEQENEDESVGIEIEEPEGEEIITDSGRFTGFVDNNHIEIMVSGVPEEIGGEVLIVDDEIKTLMEEEGITEEDQVLYEYYLNEDGVGVIVSIEEIEN